MTYLETDFFEHPWTISDLGVVRVCTRPVGELGAHRLPACGLVVAAEYNDDLEVGDTILSGGVLSLVVCDKTGSRRSLHLSKDNLFVDHTSNAAQGLFMWDMRQALDKADVPITGMAFIGMFCDYGA